MKKVLKSLRSIDIILNFCYFHKTIGNISIFALVAQLAEHIHGKDKVISSILIEGYVFARAKQSASQRRFARQIEGYVFAGEKQGASRR